jgi:heptosyltransferase-3
VLAKLRAGGEPLRRATPPHVSHVWRCYPEHSPSVKKKISILLIRLGGLGDLLAVLPSLRLLRRFYPGSRFTLVCRAEYGLLLKSAALVEEVLDAGSSRFTGLFGRDNHSDPKLKSWLKSYDQTWGWRLGESSLDLEAALRRHGAKSVRVMGPPGGPSRPLSRHYFDLTAEALGGAGAALAGEFDSFCRLELSEGQVSAARAENLPAVIHPGSGSRKKCWPLDRFLAVAGRLADDNISGFIVTGEAEGWLEPELKRHRFPPGWTWVAQPSLIWLAARLSACRVYLGNDSGVTHLAAACGARVLALFRREAQELWRPCGRVTLLSAEEVADIGLDKVWEELKRRDWTNGSGR